MVKFKSLLIGIAMLSCFGSAKAQLSGNFQIEAQTYKEDAKIGAEKVDEEIRASGFLNLNYTSGNFNMGLRYESYNNPLLGIDPSYAGSGIAYRYGSYLSEFVDFTVGDFYEQFGSGMIFRSYEERSLGIDNALDGIRVKVRPHSAVELTGIIGKQRYYWAKGEGIIRGGDINIGLNGLFEGLLPDELNATLGASVVSKYQEDIDPQYNLPLNTLAYSARFGLSGSFFNFDGEYAYKYNDPNSTNNFSFNPGNGIMLNTAFFTKGLSLSLSAHRVDNMDFRSDRNVGGNMLMVGYIPAITKQHTYKLASMYPYSTQLNGEAGFQTELAYKIPSGNFLSGKYGTSVTVNYSRIFALDTTHTQDLRYESKFGDISSRYYYQDFNLTIQRKFSDKFKASIMYQNTAYDRDLMENQGSPKYGKVKANTIILDGTYRFNSTNALKIEAQHMWSKHDSTITHADLSNGNWLMLFAEYTIAPKWFFSVSNEYNYDNKWLEQNEETGQNIWNKRTLNYMSTNVAYLHGASRVSLGYGKQRGGVVCVGGVCRLVPATNGWYLSLTSSF